jgi:acetyltransferase-like isoleucine patch superfamily enzyme
MRLKRALHAVHRRYAVRENVTVGQSVHIGLGSILWALRRLTVGDRVYIGKGCTIEVDGDIGDDVLVANRVGVIGRRDHDISQVGVAMRQARWVGDFPEHLSAPVHIGDDVWLGFGCIVLSDVTIGRGAVVAAGAVVSTDVAPYDVVAGNPARTVKVRFDGPEIETHECALYGRRRTPSER